MAGSFPIRLFGRSWDLGTLPSFINAWLVMLSFFGSMASVNTACAQALYSMNIMYYYGAEPDNPFMERKLDLWSPVSQGAFSHQVRPQRHRCDGVAEPHRRAPRTRGSRSLASRWPSQSCSSPLTVYPCAS